jgi:hypothetical protein
MIYQHGSLLTGGDLNRSNQLNFHPGSSFA